MREFSAKLGHLELVLEWRLTLLTLLLLPGLVALGFWQLDRAAEKRTMLAQDAARTAMAPVTLTDLNAFISKDSAPDLAGREIGFEGQFLGGRYWLLDNRTRDGRVGYEVIALAGADRWLIPVNLGWVQGDPSRRTLPTVELPRSAALITGRVYQPSRPAYLLSDQALPNTFPAVIQAFDGPALAAGLSKALNQPLFPLEVRISEGHSAAFRADWPVVNQSPEKHTGYAVQWFTMAAVLAVAFLFRSSNLWLLIRGHPAHNPS